MKRKFLFANRNIKRFICQYTHTLKSNIQSVIDYFPIGSYLSNLCSFICFHELIYVFFSSFSSIRNRFSPSTENRRHTTCVAMWKFHFFFRLNYILHIVNFISFFIWWGWKEKKDYTRVRWKGWNKITKWKQDTKEKH